MNQVSEVPFYSQWPILEEHLGLAAAERFRWCIYTTVSCLRNMGTGETIVGVNSSQ